MARKKAEMTEEVNEVVKSAEIVEPKKKKRGRKPKNLNNVSEGVTATEKAEKTKKSGAKYETLKAELMEDLHEELEQLRFDLRSSLAETMRSEYQSIAERAIRKANSRRRWNNFFHDIVIIAFAIVAGYFGYRLYELKYFAFQKTDDGVAEVSQSEEKPEQIAQDAGPIKDEKWYFANYRYLFDNLDRKADADSLTTYRFYQEDQKVEDMDSEILLAMAYHQIAEQNSAQGELDANVPLSKMEEAFRSVFGKKLEMSTVDFNYGCEKFKFDVDEKQFVRRKQSGTCEQNKNYSIVEEIEKIYAEGEALYVITNAAVYEKATKNLYNFDDLFKPVMKNVAMGEVMDYSEKMNRYQYRFLKLEDEDKYIFTGITKLR